MHYNFNFEKFKTFTLIEKLDFLDDEFCFLGKGSARSVYKLSNNFAIKVAINSKGIRQNEIEKTISKDKRAKNIIAKVVLSEKDNKFNIVECAKQFINEEDFKEKMNIEWDLFSLLITEERELKYVNNLNLRNLILNTRQLIDDYNLNQFDISSLEHWGLTKKNNCVLLDYGLDNTLFHSC